MARVLSVHLLPGLFVPEDLADGIAVVIDVLRASTTIARTLAAGARCVIPFGEVEEAIARERGFPEGSVRGGERGGVRIEGFDLGNSPDEYTAERVAGKTVQFTTTNGTRAMLRCAQARRVLIGSLVNRQAVADVLINETGSVHLVCAGTDGRITLEDALCAGLLTEALLQHSALDLNDEAVLALATAESYGSSPEGILEALRGSRGGVNLLSLGLGQDIETAGQLDSLSLVPELDLATWQIVCIPASQR